MAGRFGGRFGAHFLFGYFGGIFGDTRRMSESEVQGSLLQTWEHCQRGKARQPPQNLGTLPQRKGQRKLQTQLNKTSALFFSI